MPCVGGSDWRLVNIDGFDFLGKMARKEQALSLSCILPIPNFTRDGHWVIIITHYPIKKLWVTFLPCYPQAPTGNLVHPSKG